MRPGGQCVMIRLLQLMPMWHVDSWDTLDTVSDLLYVLVASFPDLTTIQFLLPVTYCKQSKTSWLEVLGTKLMFCC